MTKFTCAVCSERKFAHMDKQETFFFLKSAPWYDLNFFNYLFIH